MPFKKGQSGNPKGGKPLPPEVKEARKMNANEMHLALNKFMFLSLEDLEKAKADPQNTAIELLCLKILIMGLKTGDPKYADYFFNRLIGKVKEEVETKGSIEVIIKDYTE